MTVAELITELAAQPSDREVFVMDGTGTAWPARLLVAMHPAAPPCTEEDEPTAPKAVYMAGR